MALSDLQSLAAGNAGIQSNGAQTIIVTQPGNQGGSGCIPCDDSNVCEVRPTNATRLDLSKFSADSPTIRFNVDTTTALDPTLGRYMIFFSGLNREEYPDYYRLIAGGYTPILGGNTVHDGSLVNSVNADVFMASFNASGISGGTLMGMLKFKYNSVLFPQNSGITVESIFMSPDPADGLDVNLVLDPMCSYCNTNSNGDFVVTAYTANMPVSTRNIVAIFIPGAAGGTQFTLDICFNSNGLPNTEQATWVDQENG